MCHITESFVRSNSIQNCWSILTSVWIDDKTKDRFNVPRLNRRKRSRMLVHAVAQTDTNLQLAEIWDDSSFLSHIKFTERLVGFANGWRFRAKSIYNQLNLTNRRKNMTIHSARYALMVRRQRACLSWSQWGKKWLQHLVLQPIISAGLEKQHLCPCCDPNTSTFCTGSGNEACTAQKLLVSVEGIAIGSLSREQLGVCLGCMFGFWSSRWRI